MIYARTLRAATDAADNPFAEPVILHRNFEHGFGVFALGNRNLMVIPAE